MPANKIHFKHNKYRNTAFLFEAIVRTLASAKMRKDEESAVKITAVLKKYFGQNTELAKELKLYTLLEDKCPSRSRATRILQEAVNVHSSLNQKKIFEEQSALTAQCKSDIPDFNSVFVPNYKNLATIYQIFHKAGNISDRLILEDIAVSRMSTDRNDGVLQPLDNLTVGVFTKKFNEAYSGDNLLKEQKELLGKFVMSFTPEGNLSFKTYLNEEVGRLKEECKKLLDDEDIKKDPDLTDRAKQIGTLLEGLLTKKVDSTDMKKILKIQQLVGEK